MSDSDISSKRRLGFEHQGQVLDNVLAIRSKKKKYDYCWSHTDAG
jgi:hypothetical protein